MARTAKRKASPKATRGLDATTLPYADETQAANDVLEFLFERLPRYVASELRNIDIAVTEANLYRELSSLPDETLRRAGLKRSDLPALVASAFHLIRLSQGRKRRATRRPSRAAPRARKKKSTTKRTTARRASRA